MTLQCLITPVTAHDGRTTYSVWQYDLERPRLPDAEDPRARYAVHQFIGTYRTLPAAEAAIARTELLAEEAKDDQR